MISRRRGFGDCRHRYRGSAWGHATIDAAVILLGLVAGHALWFVLPSPPGGAGPAGLIAGRAAAAELLRGEFTEGVGTYGGEGTAIVSDRPDGSYTVRFADFRVSRGPDLHVWLVAHPNPQTNEDVLASKTLPLGPLKATSGAQAYPIPAGTDFAEYQSLVIWCKRVNALFSPAVLQ